MAIDYRFGHALREARERKQLTLRELAARLDQMNHTTKYRVDFSYLAKIERHALPPPRPKRIRELAKALHADANELLAAAALDRLPRAARARLIDMAAP
jgi:transcriptional regulator with XRE-family HTH domain